MSDPRRSANLDFWRDNQPPKESEKIPAYQPSSETSMNAAKRVSPHTAAMRETVRDAVANAGDRGVTRKELESITGYLTQTLCARLNELEQSGEIRKLRRLNEKQQVEILRRDECSIYVSAKRKAVA